VDYSAMIAKIGNLDIDVVFFSGYIEEAGLIVRQARDQGADFQFIVGDGVASQQFWLIADSAAEGTLMTSYPDPANNPDAIPVTERLRTKNVEIGPVSFYAYAAVQVWAQSVEKADTLDLNPVIESLRNQRFDTILGNIGFDDKGDVNGYEPFVWYVWKNGDYVLKE
jgi:branched-chain amino acid transport system substrate-binding protein